MTRPSTVVQVDPQRPEPEIIARAAAIIRRGGLVAFPTETVYGLGANGLDADAVRGIFTAKRRDLADPLILHVLGVEQLPEIVTAIPPIAQMLVTRFWPGPLTLVLPKQPSVPDIATAGLSTVAVRAPSHPVARALIAAASVPIAAPSANLFMRTSATTAAHVLEDLGDRVDLILDGGPAPHGIESSVVAISEKEVRLLRPGATTAEAIADALGELEPPTPLLMGAAGRAASPGLLARHYSPHAAVFLFAGEREQTRTALRQALRDALASERRIGALLADEDLPLVDGLTRQPSIVGLGSETDLATIASRLFDGLRQLDAAGCEAVYARTFGTAGLGLAILDRLTRAAHRDDNVSSQ